jgi:hypothetical protein
MYVQDTKELIGSATRIFHSGILKKKLNKCSSKLRKSDKPTYEADWPKGHERDPRYVTVYQKAYGVEGTINYFWECIRTGARICSQGTKNKGFK